MGWVCRRHVDNVTIMSGVLISLFQHTPFNRSNLGVFSIVIFFCLITLLKKEWSLFIELFVLLIRDSAYTYWTELI